MNEQVDIKITRWKELNSKSKEIEKEMNLLKEEIKLLCNGNEYESEVGQLVVKKYDRTDLDKELVESMLGTKFSEVVKTKEIVTYTIK